MYINDDFIHSVRARRAVIYACVCSLFTSRENDEECVFFSDSENERGFFRDVMSRRGEKKQALFERNIKCTNLHIYVLLSAGIRGGPARENEPLFF